MISIGACKSCACQQLVDHIEVILLAVSDSLVVFLGLFLGGHVASDFAFHVFKRTRACVKLVLFEGSLMHLRCSLAQNFGFGDLSVT